MNKFKGKLVSYFCSDGSNSDATDVLDFTPSPKYTKPCSGVRKRWYAVKPSHSRLNRMHTLPCERTLKLHLSEESTEKVFHIARNNLECKF